MKILIFVTLVTLSSAYRFPPPQPTMLHLSKHTMVRGRPWHGLVPKPMPSGFPSARSVSGTWSAKVDNFDCSNNKTYEQRYWYNDEWYSSGGPQFLMIGGESTAGSGWLDSDGFEWTALAKQVGAAVFVLEHRFYGNSQPTGDLSFASLKYLTSQQALADVKNFIEGMNKKFAYTSPRWITFGGSYSGALSAWMRQVYPETVYAAVGSSGPVQAVVDFTGYLEVVYQALHNYDSKCSESVHSGFESVKDLVQNSQNIAALKSTFRLCKTLNTSDPDTLTYFYESIIHNYMIIVQYSGINSPGYRDILTIANLCKKQLGAATALDGVAAVHSWLMKLHGESCLEVNYPAYIDSLASARAGTPIGDFRAWIWQTCNEFGFFQSTDSRFVTANFTGSHIPYAFFMQQCAQIFDASLNNATVYANIDSTNDRYMGQKDFKGTKVVFPNGTNDPWHVLGILAPTNDKTYPVISEGTSHCADMYGPGKNDNPSLTVARSTIGHHVISWINE